ncbi:deuterolysin metalloprotease [Colletotrichum phormii]|uniref:Neutral protease 2 n=1 Tax=Colletotrichum phormii TaxID=359342 RepID=A0AAI9ZK40_9PEZI|nr:deuterolysin metalloprotease [Colletotrichum phormii]KAK1633470.1 deuterolysin metalloprotease [Colletotrichum phormii]
MKFSIGVSLLATLASAVNVDMAKRDTSPLDVKLEAIGNSGVKAALTNTGDSAIKLFKTGTFLDKAPVEKVEVFAAGNKIDFDGIRLQIATSGLTEEAFQIVAAGETVEVEFDAAELHDLSTGGAVEIVTQGSFLYADADSTDIAGAVPFSSNSIKTEVNGDEAASVRNAFIEKRTAVQADCTGTRRTATVNAITRCRSLAVAASSAAASGPAARMTEYFKSSTTATRNTVAAVFGRIVSECGSTTSGVSRQYCSDVYGACSSNVIAYTLPSQSYMVNFLVSPPRSNENPTLTGPTFFTMSAASSTCHAQDQQTTIVHEMTHLTQIKGTSDYNGYGYNFVRSLTAAQNLNHADTYTLFAQSIYAGC